MPHDPAALPIAPPPRPLPDLAALQAFVAVCEAGSMVLAARRLGVSQSAVSQQVKSLEREWEVVLFDRDVRPARPTPAGQALLAHADRLLAQARGLADRMRASARRDHALIRLGCVDSFAATVGPELVRALSGSARELRLWSGLGPALAGQLRARELDLAVCTEPGPADARLHVRRLFSEAWVAVFPKAHRAGPVTSPGGLAACAGTLPLVRYSERSVIGQQVERWLRHAGIDAPRRFEFDATDPLLALVAAGLGWAISTPLCLWQSRAWLDAVRVVPLPGGRPARREFFLLSREAEWTGLDEEIARVARAVIRRDVAPAVRRALPVLPASVFDLTDEARP